MRRKNDDRTINFLETASVGISIPRGSMECGKCGAGIPSSMTGCPLCAERESQIQDSLACDEAIRKGIEILSRGGYVYPVLVAHKQKNESQREVSVLVRHLRHRAAGRFFFCRKTVNPKASGTVPTDAKEIRLRESKDPGLHCPECLAAISSVLS